MVSSLVEQDDDMTGIPQIDKQALGEPFCTIGRLVFYRRETPIRQHFRATVSWGTLKLILHHTNFATMSWKKADLKHWMLLYKGVSVEEVYDALHTKCAKIDLAMCVGELSNKRVLVYMRRNGRGPCPICRSAMSPPSATPLPVAGAARTTLTSPSPS